MRFLMLNWRDPHNPTAGGAERVSLAHLAALVRRGHDAYWFANNFPGAGRAETIEGVHIVRGGGLGTSIRHAIRWYRRQPPFDLVIDQHHGIPWYAPWWCRTHCLAYIHEVLGPIWSVFYPRPLALLGRWQERWTHRLYRKVPFWTVSESTRKALLAHGVERVVVFPNGINTVALAALDDKPLAAPLRLVVVCRLAANKRVDHAIRVLPPLRVAGIDAQLTVVGSGEQQPQLRALVDELRLTETVSFTGAVPEVEKDVHLRRAHFLLHTSVREGWGLNVIEANAMGTPAVVYPVAGLVDSTLHGQTGLVTPEETPEALAASLVEAVRRPEDYARLRHNAWQRAKSLHWDHVLPATCAWLEEQARQPRRPAALYFA
ncbi:MAG: glycosyltransferase family 4 protein [Verrucomicrobia bacterium]|nr:glycosyltransferase family 4 protein [Verrucomicrobiota bacterium]